MLSLSVFPSCYFGRTVKYKSLYWNLLRKTPKDNPDQTWPACISSQQLFHWPQQRNYRKGGESEITRGEVLNGGSTTQKGTWWRWVRATYWMNNSHFTPSTRLTANAWTDRHRLSRHTHMAREKRPEDTGMQENPMKRSDSLPHFPKMRATRGHPAMGIEAPSAWHISFFHMNKQPTVWCLKKALNRSYKRERVQKRNREKGIQSRHEAQGRKLGKNKKLYLWNKKRNILRTS